jgi:hypothetical protein
MHQVFVWKFIPKKFTLISSLENTNCPVFSKEIVKKHRKKQEPKRAKPNINIPFFWQQLTKKSTPSDE